MHVQRIGLLRLTNSIDYTRGWLICQFEIRLAAFSRELWHFSGSRAFSRVYHAEITFLGYIRHFLSDFENNGTVEISEFFCVGLAIENKFLDRNFFGVWWSPWGSVICGGRLPQKAHLRHLR